MANGIPLPRALVLSHDFVHRAMACTIKSGIDGKEYGPCFEPVLYTLGEAIRKELDTQVG